ncbi:MAG: pantetheine-phosphate adenylyltransferase [bacterium]|nr:pantetheine-phosphate adenylyltransferase [bacterium]
MEETIAVYPGTFDPVTRGHLDVIHRGLIIFKRLIVAVVNNPKKHPVFSIPERVEMIQESTAGMPGELEVDSFDGLLVEYMRKRKANVVLRGLRAISDYEYELEMALTNRHLNEEVETIFLTPSEKYIYLRASTVREIASRNGDVSAFVTPNVEKRLIDFYR